jgi:hypothetical protein
MKSGIATYGHLCCANASMSVWQWDTSMHGKKAGTYFVACNNLPLAHMQGVNVSNMHIECIVDDFGNLVKATS